MKAFSWNSTLGFVFDNVSSAFQAREILNERQIVFDLEQDTYLELGDKWRKFGDFIQRQRWSRSFIKDGMEIATLNFQTNWLVILHTPRPIQIQDTCAA